MRRLGRVLGVVLLLGTALFVQAAADAPTAIADSGGATNCSDGMLLCTSIQYGGSFSPNPRDPTGAGGGSSGGYISSCWLEPLTAWGDPDEDASSPAGMAQYFDDMGDSGLLHDPAFQQWYAFVEDIYSSGHEPADPGVGLKSFPYNEGTAGGSWYTIACDMQTYKYSDYVAIQLAMGVSTANLNYEGWFWITNPAALPPNLIVTPTMLAEYAANHVLIAPEFPALSPAATTTQTVDLPVESVNTRGEHGYKTYSTSATLAGITSRVTSYPVTVTYTSDPADLISPESVTCDFNRNGSIKTGCGTFEFTRPAALSAGDTLIATTTWDVTWGGNAAYGEAGWTQPLPGVDPVFTQTINVQAVQAINISTASPSPIS